MMGCFPVVLRFATCVAGGFCWRCAVSNAVSCFSILWVHLGFFCVVFIVLRLMVVIFCWVFGWWFVLM